MTTEMPMDIHPTYHSNDFNREAVSETIPNPETRDTEICICKVQSCTPRAQAHSYYGEYDHIL
jgi:hypothetical protein